MITKNNLILSLVVTALVFFAAGYYFEGQMFEASINSRGSENTYKAGWEAAKERLKETDYYLGDEEISYVNGVVQKVENKKIYLEIGPLTPLADPDLDNRVVIMDKNTKIYKLKEKNDEQFQREMDQFQKRVEELEAKENSEEEVMKLYEEQEPEFFIKKSVGYDQINEGDFVSVEAQEDITEQKEFKAVVIEVEETN